MCVYIIYVQYLKYYGGILNLQPKSTLSIQVHSSYYEKRERKVLELKLGENE